MWSYNPCAARDTGLGCSLFARHYLGNHVCFLFLLVLRCFSSQGWLPCGWHTFSMPGCPIRRSGDLMLVCSSPQLIAAYHVLHRLSEPRHPPYALKCFKRVITITRHLQLKYLLPNMSKNYFLFPERIHLREFVADVMVTNQQTITSHHLVWKNFLLWRISESNRWPSACKADALANWANPPSYLSR